MEFLGFLFEIIFLSVGLSSYLILSGRLRLKGLTGQQLSTLTQNVGLLKKLSLVLSFFAGVSLVLHILQFVKK
jgi:hypothetical protein